MRVECYYSGTFEQWTLHYSEVSPSSEVLTCIQLLVGGTQFVHCREVVSVHYRRFHCTLLVSSLCIYLTVDYEITTLYALKTFPLYIHRPYIPYSLIVICTDLPVDYDLQSHIVRLQQPLYGFSVRSHLTSKRLAVLYFP